MAQVLPNHETSVTLAAQTLKQGELVGIPTETVYGLAGNATDANAVAKIFSTKARPSFDPLIVHIPESNEPWSWLEKKKIVQLNTIPTKDLETIKKLTENFWPGPLTLVLPKGEAVPDIVTSGLNRVGVRMPDHPLTQAVLKLCDLPLAAPSANRFGRISPTTAKAVDEEIGDRIGLILDGGTSRVGVESTVLLYDETSSSFQILRPGGVSKEDLEKVLARKISEKTTGAILAPGMTESHYAPRKPTFRFANYEKLSETEKNARLKTFAEKWNSFALLTPEMLSKTLNDVEAAATLFQSLRKLDAETHTQAILVVLPEKENGLWAAIRDRLTRASVEF